MICAGIDAGSRSIKVVLFDADRSEILAATVADQGVEQQRLASNLLEQAARQAGLSRSDIAATIATGYGRNALTFAQTTVTEITCHARGVHHLAPAARTILEIGGQDSKVIHLDAHGRVRDFAMNDRCAAGTGRFLELVAERLNVSLSALGELRRQCRKPASITNTCVVFAETEIVGLLAEGTAPADIAAGVQSAIATRMAALAGRTLTPPVYFTGGVALHSGMLRAFEEALACPIQIPPQPQFTGALGAAILAGESVGRGTLPQNSQGSA